MMRIGCLWTPKEEGKEKEAFSQKKDLDSRPAASCQSSPRRTDPAVGESVSGPGKTTRLSFDTFGIRRGDLGLNAKMQGDNCCEAELDPGGLIIPVQQRTF